MDDPSRILRRLGFDLAGGKQRGQAVELIARRGQARFAVEARTLRDVRAEHVMGILADAYVRLRRDASAAALRPLIVLEAPRWTPAMVRRVFDYRDRYLDDCGIALIGDGGAVHVVADDLRADEAGARPRRERGKAPAAADMFSDLGQWLLKVLIKQALHLKRGTVTGPVGTFSTHRELAAAADVSVSRAWTLHRLLGQQGFLGDPLVRVDDLLDRWRGAVRPRRRQLPARWVVGTDHSVKRLQAHLEGRAEWSGTGEATRISWTRAPRMCFAGHAAARGLGHGFVAGAIPELYVEGIDEALLARFAAVRAEPGTSPDFVLIEPRYPEAVFRACVPGMDGAPTADAIQTWLDLVDHPDRGAEQADVLYKKVLHAAT